MNLKFDFKDYYYFYDIKDKNELMLHVLKSIPINCKWSVEGLFDKALRLFLKKYHVKFKVKRLTLFPVFKIFYIYLTEKSNAEICDQVENWDFEDNFIHQQIWNENKILFYASDNIKEYATFISKKVDIEKLKEGALKGYFKLGDT